METDGVNLNEDEAVRTECGRLYLAALKGDWNSIQDIQNIQRCIADTEETTLHIAAAANQEEFVKNLLNWMILNNHNITAENTVGNTALTFAAAVGNVWIANAMLDINPDLPNIGCGVKPVLMAAISGRGPIVKLLYPRTRMDGIERAEIFITCVKNNLYEAALEMLEAEERDLAGDLEPLARAKYKGETALHVLARKPSAFACASQPGLLRRNINILRSKLKEENSKQSKANKLFIKCLQAYKCDAEQLRETPEIIEVLFVAAEIGNVEFLVQLICFDFHLLWKKRNDKKCIFLIAVEQRHESIFNLLGELGSIRDILVSGLLLDQSNILHLAAGLAPQAKLNAISGAALQMQRELLWFKEVEKFVSPGYIEMKNNKGYTPSDLFAEKHEKLRRDGEKWMRDTANYSMVVAALIGSIMFTGQVADGLNNNPHLFLAFTVSTAISLFGSSTSLIMFLSILTSRYSFEDFLVSLPVRLMIGVTSLYISIAAMMVSFATSFWLKNYNHRDVIFIVIVLCACVPIMEVLLKYRLVFDIFQSTFFRFRPQHRLLHKEISNAPVRRSHSHAPADVASV